MEVSNLESDKSELERQKLELKRKYQSLYDNYQQKQNEVTNLEKEMEELSKGNQSKVHKTSQATTQSVATNPKISVQEWKQISNQGDYEYVKGHVRNGKWVNEYYRRPRRRQVK